MVPLSLWHRVLLVLCISFHVLPPLVSAGPTLRLYPRISTSNLIGIVERDRARARHLISKAKDRHFSRRSGVSSITALDELVSSQVLS